MQRLDGQMAAVGVHHQTRKPVRLAVDQAAGVGIGHHPAPIVQGPFEAALPKVTVYRFVACGHHPQGDAGGGAVKGLAQEAALWVGHGHQIARRNFRQAFQVIAVDPGVAGAAPPESLRR